MPTTAPSSTSTNSITNLINKAKKKARLCKKKMQKKIIISILFFIAAIITSGIMSYQYTQNKDTKDTISAINARFQKSKDTLNEKITIQKKAIEKAESNLNTAQGCLKNKEALKECSFRHKTALKEEQRLFFKYNNLALQLQITETESTLLWGATSERLSLFTLTLLLLIGSIASFLLYLHNNKEKLTAQASADQYSCFELAHEQCSELEANEKRPRLDSASTLELQRLLKKSYTLWAAVNTDTDILSDALLAEKHLYTHIENMKIPPKKSIQVRANLIRAIHDYKPKE